MAQAAMIIHTRTRSCDFPSTLAVCPAALSHSEVEQVRKKILAATRFIDGMRLNEVRQMVYTCGNYVVAGMVSFLKNLANENAGEEKFFTDEKGRNIYAFVGIVFQRGNQVTPFIDRRVLWENFKLYMEPVWGHTVLETQISRFVEVDFADAGSVEPVGGETVDGQTLYVMGVDDTSIFSYWLGQALKGKTAVSFCSNITDFRVAKEKNFRMLTTTANIVERIKKKTAVSPPPLPHQTRSMSVNPSVSSFSGSCQKKNVVRNGNGSHGKKFGGKSNNIWIPIVSAIFVLILLLLLLR